MSALQLGIEKAKAAWNSILQCGPFLLSQSEKASDKWAAYVQKVGIAKAGKEFFLEEIRIYGKTKEVLLEKLMNASPDEQPELLQKLEWIEAKQRRVGIRMKALPFVEERVLLLDASENDKVEAAESSEHWLDKFDQFSRARNEEWRQNLLAKALAREATASGSISVRALWFIGTMEETMFSAFAKILDLSTGAGGDLLIPDDGYRSLHKKGTGFSPAGNDLSIESLVYLLSDVNLIAHNAYRMFKADVKTTINYHNRKLIFTPKNDITNSGVILSQMGKEISKLYEPRYHPLGESFLIT